MLLATLIEKNIISINEHKKIVKNLTIFFSNTKNCWFQNISFSAPENGKAKTLVSMEKCTNDNLKNHYFVTF